MRLDNVTAVDTTGADTAVVWTLGTRISSLGPAIGPAVGAQKSVFLLQTKPDFMFGISFHQASRLMSIVELVGRSIGVPGLAHDENVVSQTDGIGVHGHRTNVDIGVVARGL